MVYIPGSLAMSGKDVRADILRKAPQTYDDVAMQLIASEVKLPDEKPSARRR